MARVTVEDCLERVNNRFELVHVAVQRTKQILLGSHPLVNYKNRPPVLALREIAQGFIKPISYGSGTTPKGTEQNESSHSD